MSAWGWVAMGVLLMCAVFGTYVMPRFWRGEQPSFSSRRAPGWWLWGEWTWEAYQRLLVPAIAWIWI